MHRGALTFGHSFTLTELTSAGLRTKGLSALRTAALYEDPANDDTPHAALTVTRRPTADLPGVARMFDATHEYRVTFKGFTDVDSIRGAVVRRHGASECPVTRFAAAVDLERRAVGVVEPMIPLQNRINQTGFDLPVAQTYASFKVRTATGMAPPIRRDADGEPVLDDNGQPIPPPININAKRFLFAKDPDVKFSSLAETPLGGFIDSIDMSIRHLSAISQTPPHHLLGQIANLNAEALLAAETALSRKIEEFRKGFGESWERVFRVAAELSGDTASAGDYAGEVLWRDMEMKSLAQSADGLGKFAEALSIPRRGLWSRVPGVTATEIREWEQIREDDDAELQLAQALRRAGAGSAGGGVTSPARTAEAEQTSIAYHVALTQLGAATIEDALRLWQAVPPTRTAALSAAWLRRAITLVMTAGGVPVTWPWRTTASSGPCAPERRSRTRVSLSRRTSRSPCCARSSPPWRHAAAHRAAGTARHTAGRRTFRRAGRRC